MVTQKNELQFWETPSGSPHAIRAWFSPGDNLGQEFPYPQSLVLIKPAVPVLEPARIPSAASVVSHAQRATNTVQQSPPPQPPPSSPQVNSSRASPMGSWAIITGGSPEAEPHTGLWHTLQSLPLTATLAPLIGLIGVASLVFYLMSYLKRKKRDTTPM